MNQCVRGVAPGDPEMEKAQLAYLQALAQYAHSKKMDVGLKVCFVCIVSPSLSLSVCASLSVSVSPCAAPYLVLTETLDCAG